MGAFRFKSVPVTVLPGALISLTSFWLVGLWVASVQNRYSKDGVSQASLFWLSVVCLIPLVCIVLVMALLFTRKRLHERLSAFDWCGLGIACFPILALCWVVVMSLREYL
jgi:hypothetical protein